MTRKTAPLPTNGSLRRLRLVSTIAAVFCAVLYLVSRHIHDPMVLTVLVGWNVTTLGLYQWDQLRR